jgi:hypothetical protein
VQVIKKTFPKIETGNHLRDIAFSLMATFVFVLEL